MTFKVGDTVRITNINGKTGHYLSGTVGKLEPKASGLWAGSVGGINVKPDEIELVEEAIMSKAVIEYREETRPIKSVYLKGTEEGRAPHKYGAFEPDGRGDLKPCLKHIPSQVTFTPQDVRDYANGLLALVDQVEKA